MNITCTVLITWFTSFWWWFVSIISLNFGLVNLKKIKFKDELKIGEKCKYDAANLSLETHGKTKGAAEVLFFSAVSLASNGASSQCLDHHDFINTLIQIFQDTQDML